MECCGGRGEALDDWPAERRGIAGMSASLLRFCGGSDSDVRFLSGC